MQRLMKETETHVVSKAWTCKYTPQYTMERDYLSMSYIFGCCTHGTSRGSFPWLAGNPLKPWKHMLEINTSPSTGGFVGYLVPYMETWRQKQVSRECIRNYIPHFKFSLKWRSGWVIFLAEKYGWGHFLQPEKYPEKWVSNNARQSLKKEIKFRFSLSYSIKWLSLVKRNGLHKNYFLSIG